MKTTTKTDKIKLLESIAAGKTKPSDLLDWSVRPILVTIGDAGQVLLDGLGSTRIKHLNKEELEEWIRTHDYSPENTIVFS